MGKYKEQQKLSAVEDYCRGQADLRAVAQRHGIDVSSLQNRGSKIHILPTHFEGSSIERRGRRQFALQFFESGAQHCP